MRKTLRHNMQYDGMFFDLKWKASKVDRPKVMCICDVSGSVSNYSRFLLMFLYSLAEILPKVRSFAFSSDALHIDDEFVACIELLLKLLGKFDDFGDIAFRPLHVRFDDRHGARFAVRQTRVALRRRRGQQTKDEQNSKDRHAVGLGTSSAWQVRKPR